MDYIWSSKNTAYLEIIMVENKISAVRHYTWLLIADDRNQKEDVTILTYPPLEIPLYTNVFSDLVEVEVKI